MAINLQPSLQLSRTLLEDMLKLAKATERETRKIKQELASAKGNNIPVSKEVLQGIAEEAGLIPPNRNYTSSEFLLSDILQEWAKRRETRIVQQEKVR
jgi:hypothetical protein